MRPAQSFAVALSKCLALRTRSALGLPNGLWFLLTTSSYHELSPSRLPTTRFDPFGSRNDGGAEQLRCKQSNHARDRGETRTRL